MSYIAEKSGLARDIGSIRFIHIAGTNGKGSAAAMCASVLKHAGYKTGLYVSPHVEDFCERIRVDGEMIPKEKFAECLEFFIPYIDSMDKEEYGDVKEFEMITLCALRYFAETSCEYVAFEVGIGGRLDATNIISPFIALIMSISRDHTAQLGNTLEKIAYEKCGIIKNGTPTVVYPLFDEYVAKVISAVAKYKNAELYFPQLPENISVQIDGTSFSYAGREHKCALVGINQAYNAVAVLKCVEVLRKLGTVISDEAVKNGLLDTEHPSRFEIVCTDPLLIIDGAHNEGGVRSLDDNIKHFCHSGRKVFIVGMCADHVTDEVLSCAVSENDTVFTAVASGTSRAMDANELARRIAPYVKEAIPCESLAEAVKKALRESRGDDIICFGSLYLAKEIKEALKTV